MTDWIDDFEQQVAAATPAPWRTYERGWLPYVR